MLRCTNARARRINDLGVYLIGIAALHGPCDERNSANHPPFNPASTQHASTRTDPARLDTGRPSLTRHWLTQPATHTTAHTDQRIPCSQCRAVAGQRIASQRTARRQPQTFHGITRPIASSLARKASTPFAPCRAWRASPLRPHASEPPCGLGLGVRVARSRWIASRNATRVSGLCRR